MIPADTVGFIRHLPHDLVAAFKATLQETREATCCVVDCADEQMQENIDRSAVLARSRRMTVPS